MPSFWGDNGTDASALTQNQTAIEYVCAWSYQRMHITYHK